MDLSARLPRRTDAGFTLTELLMVTVLVTVLGTLGITTLAAYAERQTHEGAANELVGGMRLAAQRSLSEGRSFCVRVDQSGDAWTVFRRTCGTGGQQVGGTTVLDDDLDLRAASFTTPAGTTCPAGAQCVYFFPRGTASGGSATVRRGTSDDITITVEGLTSRVDRTD